MTCRERTVIRVSLVGRQSAEALRAACRWEVLAVFRRSFYCRSRRGPLVCFGLMTLGPGPLNALCQVAAPIDWELADLLPGTAAACDGSVFCLAEHFVFSLAGARLWRPEVLGVIREPAAMFESLAVLAQETRRRPVRGGLQALIPFFAANGASFAWEAGETNPLLHMALPSIASLAHWLETSLRRPGAAIPVPISALDCLIGLGPGLTPSGDDFLGGMLVALHNLGATDLAGRLATAVLQRAEHRTNEISRAHLAAAAAGEGLNPVHAGLASLCALGDSGTNQCLSAIEAMGHTSGWDALAGVSLVVAMFARARLGGGCAHQPLSNRR